MKLGWQTFKAFWTAEEVPRWFGFSLVMVYLIGLGGVGYVGVVQVRKDAATYFQQSTRYATKVLADRLALIGHDSPAEAVRVAAFRRELNNFAAHFPARWARVVDSNHRIIASTIPSEVGKTATPIENLTSAPTRFEVTRVPVEGHDSPDELIRIPLGDAERLPAPFARASSTGASAEPGDPATVGAAASSESGLHLEACLLAESGKSSILVDQAGTLTVVLVAMGVLFGLYRCLRAQLRGVTRIAGRLRTHRDRIERDFSGLRIADGVDGVTTAWNELVDLAQNLLDTVNRTEANEELTRVLARSSGGALAEALNAIPDGLMYVVDEARFEYLNATICRLLGWPVQETKRPPLNEAQSEGIGAKTLDIVRDALRADGAFEARSVLVDSADGEEANQSCYRIWVIPLSRAHRTGECLVLVRDVSQQVRAERAREEFVAQVTHELRTPLTNIRAYAETLSSGMFEDPKVITECYNVITKETRRLSRLIEDILSVSQLEVGSIELHLDSVDLKTLLSEGVRDVRGLADEKNIDIQLHLPSKAEPMRGDRDKLAVVVNNLLGNAIKYTPAEGNVLVGCQFSGDAVVLTFKDNGLGIAPEDHARIFEKFQRGDHPDVQNEAGTGIGLYTAREIVRRHGGDIELISQKDEGSTFMVRLPHRETRATALSTAEES